MASSKAILPKTKKKIEGLGTAIRLEQVKVAKQIYMARLQELVQPFDSRIEFRVQSRYNAGSYVTNISPTEDVAGTNAADKPVTSKELFTWLDEGTSVTTVVMPDEFSNETSPNSLDTNHADYDREEIYFSGNIYPGMDARNFLKQIGDLYINTYRNDIANAIRLYLDK